MTKTVVWNEIPVNSFETAISFYKTVFGYEIYMEKMGPHDNAILKSQQGHVSADLYIGRPPEKGRGTVVHLAIPDNLENAMKRCVAAGGELVGTIVLIPPGRYHIAYDPDGNSVGLFEPAHGYA